MILCTVAIGLQGLQWHSTGRKGLKKGGEHRGRRNTLQLHQHNVPGSHYSVVAAPNKSSSPSDLQKYPWAPSSAALARPCLDTLMSETAVTKRYEHVHMISYIL